MLRDAVQAADPGIEITVSSEALDPAVLLGETQPSLVHLLLHEKAEPLLVHINHHDGLHSRWTPEYIQRLRDQGIPVVVTYHDTYDGTVTPNSAKAKALLQVASAFIVHEPVTDLPGAIYLRQGIMPRTGQILLNQQELGGWPRPVLGTAGFNFPWKNYDRLAQLTGEIGWGLLILSNNATPEDEARWQGYNKYAITYPGFMPTGELVMRLAACTATAFMYECANTGTSGAIRLGIAARKPVYALQTCRQFRDLVEAEREEDNGQLINWTTSWDTLKHLLIQSWPVESDPAMVYLAERDSWAKVGQRYAEIYRSLR